MPLSTMSRDRIEILAAQFTQAGLAYAFETQLSEFNDVRRILGLRPIIAREATDEELTAMAPPPVVAQPRRGRPPKRQLALPPAAHDVTVTGRASIANATRERWRIARLAGLVKGGGSSPTNETVERAKRILEKKGIDWMVPGSSPESRSTQRRRELCVQAGVVTHGLVPTPAQVKRARRILAKRAVAAA